MYKVIIVDDEPAIRNGLRVLIPWEKYQFTAVEVAANGKEALELYHAERADLMIVDIRMPELDGLQLIEMIRNEDQEISFILLSGYADFDYARKAMAYQVDNYILKPVNEEELEASIQEVREKLRARKEESLLQVKEKGWRQAEWVKRALEVSVADTSRAVELSEAAIRLQLRWSLYQIAVLEFDQSYTRAPLSIYNQKLHDYLEERGLGVSIVEQSSIVLLLNRCYQTETDLRSLYQIPVHVWDNHELAFTMTIGVAVQEPAVIYRSYLEAVGLMQQRFFLDAEPVAHAGWRPASTWWLDKQSSSTVKEPNHLEGITEKIYLSLVIGHLDHAALFLKQAGTMMMESNYDEQQIKTSYVRMLTGAARKMDQHHPEAQSSDKHSLLPESFVELYNQVRLSKLQQTAVEMLKKITQMIDLNQTDVLVNKMVYLIEMHYNEPLRLETLADVFNYNSAYLGKLFKTNTGYYFNTFLDRVRIDKAKELLLEGEKVYSVAEKVGYANVDYFHSKFKKYVGVSPTAFRRNHLGHEEEGEASTRQS